jgi:hypothetical protein
LAVQALPFRQLRTPSHAFWGVEPDGTGTDCRHHPEYAALLKAQSARASLFGGGDPTARIVENRINAASPNAQTVTLQWFFMSSPSLRGRCSQIFSRGRSSSAS